MDSSEGHRSHHRQVQKDPGNRRRLRPAASCPNEQEKLKYWRDRALQAEARLAERDHEILKQNTDFLNFSCKAKLAERCWTAWYTENFGDQGMVDVFSEDLAGPGPSTER